MPNGKIQRILSEHRLVSSQCGPLHLEMHRKCKPVRKKPKGNATTNNQGRFFLHPCRVWAGGRNILLVYRNLTLRTSKKKKRCSRGHRWRKCLFVRFFNVSLINGWSQSEVRDPVNWLFFFLPGNQLSLTILYRARVLPWIKIWFAFKINLGEREDGDLEGLWC